LLDGSRNFGFDAFWQEKTPFPAKETAFCLVLPKDQTRADLSTAFKVALGRITALHFSESAR
jgi:hypothetical protein